MVTKEKIVFYSNNSSLTDDFDVLMNEWVLVSLNFGAMRTFYLLNQFNFNMIPIGEDYTAYFLRDEIKTRAWYAGHSNVTKEEIAGLINAGLSDSLITIILKMLTENTPQACINDYYGECPDFVVEEVARIYEIIYDPETSHDSVPNEKAEIFNLVENYLKRKK